VHHPPRPPGRDPRRRDRHRVLPRQLPRRGSLEGCELDDPLDLRALATATWTELLPKSALAGDSKNRFAIAHPGRITHLRLNIFPDGGVARLRVHGVVTPRLAQLARHGGTRRSRGARERRLGRGVQRHVLRLAQQPDQARPLAHDGRRLGDPPAARPRPRLGAGAAGGAGVIDRLEIDTSHFKGNAPGRCLVEARAGDDDWRTILLATPLQPHTRHRFADELRRRRRRSATCG
jgi:allantoicase